ncbi:hypothetical protein [Bifidobacterium jacchi]|nr:hypothetical protein [Bifidobacterium jacchi]
MSISSLLLHLIGGAFHLLRHGPRLRRMIELGFATPTLQVEFDNLDNHRVPYHVDFCWKLADGRVIVAEFDGTRQRNSETRTPS